jgi:hypothetical protein
MSRLLLELVFAGLLLFLAAGIVYTVRAGIESMVESWAELPSSAAHRCPQDRPSLPADSTGRAELRSPRPGSARPDLSHKGSGPSDTTSVGEVRGGRRPGQHSEVPA